MKRSQIAHETVEFCQTGFYSFEGRSVPLRPTLEKAVAGTALFNLETWPKDQLPPRRTEETMFRVTSETTLAAILRMSTEAGGHLACLNFASARNPGGGFLGGAEAQEESLARSSTLYPCLMAASKHYDRNRASNSLVYLDQVIWSPQVAFFRDDSGQLMEEPAYVSVMTCAAPNAGAIAQNQPERIPQIQPALERRARFILEVAVQQKVRRLILGAWGCGVFRNDPAVVAEVFSRLLTLNGPFHNVFDEVVFAIYDRTTAKVVLNAFETVFKRELDNSVIYNP